MEVGGDIGVDYYSLGRKTGSWNGPKLMNVTGDGPKWSKLMWNCPW